MTCFVWQDLRESMQHSSQQELQLHSCASQNLELQQQNNQLAEHAQALEQQVHAVQQQQLAASHQHHMEKQMCEAQLQQLNQVPNTHILLIHSNAVCLTIFTSGVLFQLR